MAKFKNPPENTPQVIPYLYYEDAGAAIDFMEKTFGFEVESCFRNPDDRKVLTREGENRQRCDLCRPGDGVLWDSRHFRSGVCLQHDLRFRGGRRRPLRARCCRGRAYQGRAPYPCRREPAVHGERSRRTPLVFRAADRGILALTPTGELIHAKFAELDVVPVGARPRE